jgi:formylglycine-generating enzyme required for sulfatase activity
VSLGLTAAGLTAAMPARADDAAATCLPGMILVPGGSFGMGDIDGFPDEKPVRQMTVKSFCLDATEVTVGAYAACAREGLCTLEWLLQHRSCRSPRSPRQLRGLGPG